MKLLIALLTLTFIISCVEDSTDTKDETNSSSNNVSSPAPTPTPTPTPTPQPQPIVPNTGSTMGSSVSSQCFAPGVGEGLDYAVITVNGAGTRSSDPSWSSTSSADLQRSNLSSSFFVTDSRLHMRVVAKRAPNPISGVCSNKFDYSKLSLSIGVKGSNSTSYLETLHFDEIENDLFSAPGCSEVLRYLNIPNNDINNPFIVEVFNVKSDWDCRWDPTIENCPRQITLPTDSCWEIQLHVATDHTKDLPRLSTRPN